MYTKQTELLKSQTNAEETHNSESSQDNEPLIEREKIEGSPFWTLKTNNEYIILFGKYKINDGSFKTKAEATKYLNKNHWDIMLRTIMIVVQDTIQENEKISKQ